MTSWWGAFTRNVPLGHRFPVFDHAGPSRKPPWPTAASVHATRDSSAGRAGDCSWSHKQRSLGRWFKSASRDGNIFGLFQLYIVCSERKWSCPVAETATFVLLLGVNACILDISIICWMGIIILVSPHVASFQHASSATWHDTSCGAINPQSIGK